MEAIGAMSTIASMSSDLLPATSGTGSSGTTPPVVVDDLVVAVWTGAAACTEVSWLGHSAEQVVGVTEERSVSGVPVTNAGSRIPSVETTMHGIHGEAVKVGVVESASR
jgi:hypothetical protein